jgi:DNA-binding CsgD family transcriptional regulator
MEKRPKLTPREIEIYTLLVTGKTIKQIASAEGVSRTCVSRHLARVQKKMGARTREQATALFVHLGFVPAAVTMFWSYGNRGSPAALGEADHDRGSQAHTAQSGDTAGPRDVEDPRPRRPG